MTAKTLMIQGTASSAGKSLLVTALCRLFRRKGIMVAPFKAQNMSLNAFITREGHEMGRAQAVQAEAAGIAPSCFMNPVLLKPAEDHVCQLIVNGRARAVMSARQYYAFRRTLRSEVTRAFTSLAKEYELIIIEGAGSPAEINLRENDLANMGMAEMANAPVLLVGDIDRGGVFASLYGTVMLLDADEQRRIRGFVVNKFRGDLSILEPGLRRLETLLGMPVLGVLPYRRFHIDEEDSLTERLDILPAPPSQNDRPAASAMLDIAVIRLPRLSNFTDFAVFDTLPQVRLRYADSPATLGKPDLVIIPGTKNTPEDMRFLEQSALAAAIRALHARGVPLIGICGGFQMLGKAIHDPLGVEGSRKTIRGLGLLHMETVFSQHKRTAQAGITVCANKGIMLGTKGMRLSGYEIHMGQSFRSGDRFRPNADGNNACPEQPAFAGFSPLGHTAQGEAEGAINDEGTLIGTYLHGIFDNPEFTLAMLNNIRRNKGLAIPDDVTPEYTAFRLNEYDDLADMVERHLDIPALERIIETWSYTELLSKRLPPF
ncbi:MAG: cobyric acid synthase [Desulfovibrio sp.]|jgi:adenosylcobyric acid synthase|nr:cobyric acid synthase [Desulfovibrio sp.]